MSSVVINKNKSASIAEALRRHKLVRPCANCGHDFIRHGVGAHAVNENMRTGGECVDCGKECKAFQR